MLKNIFFKLVCFERLNFSHSISNTIGFSIESISCILFLLKQISSIYRSRNLLSSDLCIFAIAFSFIVRNNFFDKIRYNLFSFWLCGIPFCKLIFCSQRRKSKFLCIWHLFITIFNQILVVLFYFSLYYCFCLQTIKKCFTFILSILWFSYKFVSHLQSFLILCI